MRVRVDAELCAGYGTCVSIADSVFELDEWGYAYVKADGEVEPGHEADARQAVLECPMHAISAYE